MNSHKRPVMQISLSWRHPEKMVACYQSDRPQQIMIHRQSLGFSCFVLHVFLLYSDNVIKLIPRDSLQASEATTSIFHYNDVTMSVIVSQITGNSSNYCVPGTLRGESTSAVTGGCPPQRLKNAESVSVEWRHHVVSKSCWSPNVSAIIHHHNQINQNKTTLWDTLHMRF